MNMMPFSERPISWREAGEMFLNGLAAAVFYTAVAVVVYLLIIEPMMGSPL